MIIELVVKRFCFLDNEVNFVIDQNDMDTTEDKQHEDNNDRSHDTNSRLEDDGTACEGAGKMYHNLNDGNNEHYHENFSINSAWYYWQITLKMENHNLISGLKKR